MHFSPSLNSAARARRCYLLRSRTNAVLRHAVRTGAWAMLLLMATSCAKQGDVESTSAAEQPAPSENGSDASGAESPSSQVPDSSADQPDPGPQAPDPSGVDPELTWENFGDAFMRNWCRGCHSPHLEGAARFGAPPEVNLFVYEDIVAWKERVEARATGDAPSMPPAGGPSQQELDRLERWLRAGAPSQRQVQH